MVKYYEALSHAQSLNEPLTPQLLYKIFNQIQATLIPPTILREWAEQTYLTTTDYWTFRKQVCIVLFMHNYKCVRLILITYHSMLHPHVLCFKSLMYMYMYVAVDEHWSTNVVLYGATCMYFAFLY